VEIRRQGSDLARTGPLTAAAAAAGVVAGDDQTAARAAWQTRGVENYRHVNHFEADFAEVVQSFVGDGGGLVVFVDLDRCHGDTAIAVLDALKLFLGEASCVFVLAMDFDVIAAAAAKRVDGDHARGRRYLEKLIHFPYHLPEVRFEAVFRQLQDSVVAELSGDPALWQLAENAFGDNPRRSAASSRRSTLRSQHSGCTHGRAGID
jgi:hypothetical protein